MAMKCPRCDVVYPNSERFCIECGQQLAKAEDPGEKGLIFVQHRIDRLEKELTGINERISDLKPIKLPENIGKLDAGSIGSISARLDALDMKIKAFEGQPSKSKPGDVDAFFKEFERINRMIKEEAEKSRRRDEDTKAYLMMVKKELDAANELKDEIKDLDIKGIIREIEVLKTKTNWLEEQVDKIKLQPLYDMIQELEHSILTTSASSALVIE